MSGSLLTQIKKENMIAPIQMIVPQESALGHYQTLSITRGERLILGGNRTFKDLRQRKITMCNLLTPLYTFYERPLFPIAVIQPGRNQEDRTTANGHKRSFNRVD